MKLSISLKSTLYLVLSFAGTALLGGLILALPWFHHGKLSLVDALFTSTSAVCVTGLTVVNTATKFTLAGKLVILTLIQLGGLGIMTFYALLFILLGRRLPLEERLSLKETFFHRKGIRITPLLFTILAYTFLVELGGSLVLFFLFLLHYPPLEALFHALFHAVSAFCNAGFSDLPQGLLPYAHSYALPLVIIVLILAGNTGFPIVFEVWHRLRERNFRWSLHLKLTLSVHLGLVLLGTLVLLAFEWQGAFRGLSVGERLLNAAFLSVSSRTAGFNLLPLTDLGEVSLYFLLTLMFVGACPGSTGGGVKTTTFGVLLATVLSRLRGYTRTSILGRTIPERIVSKSLTLISLYAFTVFLAQFLLIYLLPSRPFSAASSTFFARLFEVLSALGTVGLSTGITPGFSVAEKLVLVFTMLVGRVGVLSLAVLLTGLSASPKPFYYAEEEVLLG